MAPPLWRYEVRNALTGGIRSGAISPSEAWVAMDVAAGLLSSELETEDELVFRIVSESSRVSAYDAAYVALARELEVQLVTADRRMLAEFPAVAVYPDALG